MDSDKTQIEDSISEIEFDDSDSDPHYMVTEEDKRAEMMDIDDELALFRDDITHKRKNKQNQFPKPKRLRNQTERFGSRKSSENHNSFFENILSKSSSNEILQEKSNETSCEPKPCTCGGRKDVNSDDVTALLRMLMTKMSTMEEIIINLQAKMDNLYRPNAQTSSKTVFSEVDIGELNSLGLPAESVIDLNKLEEDLKDKEYKEKLTMIMDKLDGGEAVDKVLERMTHYLIKPSFLPQISWTGRGRGKEKKIALSAFVQIVNFIAISMNKIDKNYKYKNVVSDLTYGILKRAPSKFGKPKESDQISSSPSNTVDQQSKTVHAVAESVVSSDKTLLVTTTPNIPETPQNFTSEFQKFSEMFHQRTMPPLNYWPYNYRPPI